MIVVRNNSVTKNARLYSDKKKNRLYKTIRTRNIPLGLICMHKGIPIRPYYVDLHTEVTYGGKFGRAVKATAVVISPVLDRNLDSTRPRLLRSKRTIGRVRVNPGQAQTSAHRTYLSVVGKIQLLLYIYTYRSGTRQSCGRSYSSSRITIFLSPLNSILLAALKVPTNLIYLIGRATGPELSQLYLIRRAKGPE